MKLACCVWALTAPETDILQQMHNLGFDTIDIQPHMLTSRASQATAQELGLSVSCVGASFGMPADAHLDVSDEDNRQRALDHVYQSMAHAQTLGAKAVYVIPGMDNSSDALKDYARSMQDTATQAESLGLKVCIEHFPGRALSTAKQTLQFIRDINHPNLYLLFDIGHIQLSDEDPVAVIQSAGDRLGYVHLDDNDGQGDLHWSLLEGLMSEDYLSDTLKALAKIGYTGAVSLELSPNLPDPVASLKHSREIVRRLSDRIH